MSTGAGKIQSVQLKGHGGAVLCLDHSSSTTRFDSNFTEECLLSGSEDSTARLFDLRAGIKATLCIVAGDEVTSVAFGSSLPPLDQEKSDHSKNFTAYLSAGNKVLGFDLRKASSPIVKVNEDASKSMVNTILEAQDEINQISLAKQRRGSAFLLAAGDDSGLVQVSDNIDVSTSKGSPKNVLFHSKDQGAMVTSCVFRPRAKNLDLASGGTDCQVCLWDVNKPKRPSASKMITPDASGNSNQLCNPPMVHSLAWSPSGRLLAAGLGDGTSSVFSIENRSLVEVARLETSGQQSAVASVLFPAFLTFETTKNHETSQDRLLATIRNDAIIHMWDLGRTVASEKAIDPSVALSNYLDEGIADNDNEIVDAVQDLSLVADKPKLLFGIPHGKKPNWMTSSGGHDTHFPSSLFVADTTNDITVYTIPLG